MKELLITVYGGGDEAVAAVQRVSEDWRTQLEQAADEIERLRLTDAEREAIQWAVGWIKSSTPNGHCPKPLCDLLNRMTL